jgi:hypothetical protein
LLQKIIKLPQIGQQHSRSSLSACEFWHFVLLLDFSTKKNPTVNTFFEPLVEYLGKILFWDPFAAMGLNRGPMCPLLLSGSSEADCFLLST